MSILSGRFGLRVFRLAAELPEDVHTRFAANGVRGLELVKDEPVYGWSTMKHLADGGITKESSLRGSHLMLNLVKAVRKIPAALFKAELAAQEEAMKARTGLPFLSRAARDEIRELIRALMLPKAPLMLSGTAMVVAGPFVFCEATGDVAADTFAIEFRKATGVSLHRHDAAGIAGCIGVDAGAISPVSFAKGVDAGACDLGIGPDFLTWLWWSGEQGKTLPCGVLIEGPLCFEAGDGRGAEVVKLAKGNPANSIEASEAMRHGKKPVICKLSLAVAGAAVVSGAFNAQEWTWAGVSLPAPDDEIDPVDHRVEWISFLNDCMAEMLGTFLQVRTGAEWPAMLASIRAWVAERGGVL